MNPKMSLAVLGLISTQAFAFGEVGQWSSGWGQGVSEYTVVDEKNNSLYIACGDEPVTMTLTVDRVEYGSNSKKSFDLIIDGKGIEMPYETSSRVGADNFRFAWDGMRKAKTLEAKTSTGKTIVLPLKNVAKALPASKSKQFGCLTDF